MADVPDPVFSAELVGPGLAIAPEAEHGGDVRAPIDGTVVKLHPHAFVVQSADGRGVLVHLGINTVQLEGEGFTLHVEEGQTVTSGDVLVTWDVEAIAATGRSTICPVVALDAKPDVVARAASAGDEAHGSTVLLNWGS